jgi:type III pantothenate kinase
LKILTLDVGNTSVDACLFEGTLSYLGKFRHTDLPRVEADMVLVSSVRPSANALVKEVYPEAKFIKAEHVPVRTAFEGKERVGVDRLLNLFGAVRLYGENVVVASLGTALVVDLAVDGVFQGGFITLGIGSGLECLSQRAELIPPLTFKRVHPDIGTDTESAILGGFIKQSMHFLRGCLSEWQELYGRSLRLVITGGDGWLFEEVGVYDPLLIHRAMLLLYSPLQTL